MVRRKKKPRSHVLEKDSILAFTKFLPSEWTVDKKPSDYGIDLDVQIFEGGIATEKVFNVQVKATESKPKSGSSYSYQMDTADLNLYENYPIPLVIIYAITDKNRSLWKFYHLFAQKYIKEILNKKDPSWRDKKTKTIKFPPESGLTDPKALHEIADRGRFYISMLLLATKKGRIYLDGIEDSSNEELKDYTIKALIPAGEERHQDTIIALEKALNLSSILATEKMALLLNLGNAYLNLNMNEQALNNYRALLKLSEKTDDEDALGGKADALCGIGLIYSDMGKSEEALKYHKEALEIDRKIGYRQGEAENIGNIGSIYSDMCESEKALKYHKEALEIDREIGYRQGEASDLCNIGNVYNSNGDLKEALKYHKEALTIDREIGYRQGEASDLGNIGLIYSDMGESEEALKYHQEALKIDREIGYRQGEANQLGNIGLIHADKRRYKKALENLQQVLKIFEELGYKPMIEQTKRNIELIKSKMKNK